MTVTRSTRRARRGFLLRRIGWLAAAAMLAVAAIAPTSVAAANPQPQDNACNNIGSGGVSRDRFALMVGTTLLGGILGGILAIPLAAVLRVVMARYVWRKPLSQPG